MTDRIEPALSANDWTYWLRDPDDPMRAVAIACDAVSFDLRQKPERLIALANAALPDGHPAKITRERLGLLRATAEFQQQDYNPNMSAHQDALTALAFVDALASYLPPEGV